MKIFNYVSNFAKIFLNICMHSMLAELQSTDWELKLKQIVEFFRQKTIGGFFRQETGGKWDESA